MTENPEILELIAKYLNDPEDPTLKSQVAFYRSQSIENEAFYQKIERIWLLSAQTHILSQLDEEASIIKFNKRLSESSRAIEPIKTKLYQKSTLRLRWVAAAAVILALGTSLYFYNRGSILNKQPIYASDATPGGNKAVLVLSDGRKISLTDIGNGDVAKQSGLLIQKKADGQLIYTVTGEGSSSSSVKQSFNTIETPKGGMWQIRLPDGTSVWLNSMSSLTYPLSFAESEKRVVQLKGEAYFEVTKDKKHPFIVKTAKQEIEVLGTSFNVNSYTDEFTVTTTLLEGSVKVFPYHLADRSPSTLVPGQQLILTATDATINNVDANDAIDWKNGYFVFNNERQESIMRKIARWYNVRVEYADSEAKDVMYFGSVSRFDKVSKVLGKFEQTGEVRFEIDKDKITVFKVKNND